MVLAQGNHVGLIVIWFSIGNTISSGSTVISNNDSGCAHQIEDSFSSLFRLLQACWMKAQTPC